MAAKDIFHDAVKNALIKEGWTITNDPLTFKIDGINISIKINGIKIIVYDSISEVIDLWIN